jgi:hypothetical protein
MTWSDIAVWMTTLFCLWHALKTFIPSLNKRTSPMIGGIIVILAATSVSLSP